MPQVARGGPAEAKDPLIGRVVAGRYRVLELLGHGGVGRVYAALQIALDRKVALKVLTSALAQDATFRRRFRLEAEVTAQLSHPNTIAVLEHGELEPGTLFIAMELLQGRTLSQQLRRGALSQVRAIHVAQQICSSLREAHAHGVVHRDLKPANVFLLNQGGDQDFVKVLDFGMVKVFGEVHEHLTAPATFVGTPHYVAPEQARNQGPDQRADVYSLGVVLFQMLTGSVPFDGPSSVDIILKHVSEPAPRPSERRLGASFAPDLEALVLRCLAKNREERPSSMDEVLAELRRIRALLTGDAGPEPTTPPLPPRPGPGATTVGAAMPGAITPAFSMPTSAPAPAPTPMSGDRRWGRARLGAIAIVLAVVGLIFALRTGTLRAGPPPPNAPSEETESNVPGLVLEGEALRFPEVPPAQLRAAGISSPKAGWYRVCVSKDGAVASVEAVQPAPESATVIAHARAAWSFRPQPARVCSVLTLWLDPR